MDFDDEDLARFDQARRAQIKEDQSGPCEDDYESKCPYVGMLPDESDHEDGSPLRFSYS